MTLDRSADATTIASFEVESSEAPRFDDVAVAYPVVSRRMMLQVVDGDRRAFDELRRRTMPRVGRLLRVLLPNLIDSDAFVAEIYSRILHDAPAFFDQEDEPVDWLLAQAQRAVSDRLRAARMSAQASGAPQHRSVPAMDVLNDRYEIGAVLGVGGLATVYQAHDRLLGRDVAIKMFTSRVKDRADLRIQGAEARLLASQQHHGVVALFDAGVVMTEPGTAQVYLVMELVRGRNLRDRIAEGPLSARQVAHLGITLAEALEYAHGRGVVHRDIKPANVLLFTAGDVGGRLRAKLADFGVATLLGRGQSVDDDFAVGTAAYLSPEQVSGGVVGPESDVYQLGLVLLEAMTGRVEYPGSVQTSAFARLDRDPQVPDAAPPLIADTVRAMVERDPNDRTSVESVITMLRQFSLGMGSIRPERNRANGRSAPIATVGRYDLIDAPPDGAFTEIASLAARICHVPIAIVRLVDQRGVWFASASDADEAGAGGCVSISVHSDAVEGADRTDPTLLADSLVAAQHGLDFHVSVPLTTTDGYTFGTLSVLDYEPRVLRDSERGMLVELAGMVRHEMELRRALRRAVRFTG